MRLGTALGAGLMALAAPVLATAAEETAKRGGILTYMIPADAPPSFDGHRETTFATVHAAAPFYSVLIRVASKATQTDFWPGRFPQAGSKSLLSRHFCADL